MKYCFGFFKHEWEKKWTVSKILAISQHAMQSWCWKSRQGQDALEQITVTPVTGNEKEQKKVTSKLEQGLNFTVNTDFWSCNDDLCKKPEGK